MRKVIRTLLTNEGRLTSYEKPSLMCFSCHKEISLEFAQKGGSCPHCNELCGGTTNDAMARWQAGLCEGCVKLDVKVMKP